MLDEIVESLYEDETLKVDGFDDAVIGIVTDFTEPRLVYSVSKCLEILEKEMDSLEAIEHFSTNISGAYIGKQTPIWCWDNFD